MTSTSSFVLPAARRAGPAEFSPAQSSAFPKETSPGRSFEELCPDTSTHRDSHEPDASIPDQALKHAAAPEHDPALEEDSEKTEPTAAPTAEPHALPPLAVAPSLFQSLLVAPCLLPVGAVPAFATPPGAGAPTLAQPPPAENAAPGHTHPSSAPTTATTSQPPLVALPKTTPASPATPAQVGPATANLPPATSSPAQAATAPLSGPGASPTSETSTPAVPSRSLPSRVVPEKSAASLPAVTSQSSSPNEKNILNQDIQHVANTTASVGTRNAPPAAIMSSPRTTSAQPVGETSVSNNTTPAAVGQGALADTLSVDWKGWTNGGGERASTAAQFSQLGEKLSLFAAPSGVAAVPGQVRAPLAAAPASPASPLVPADAAEALAPIHSAIERLVLHGREQLALTVRFEQGGSLSIRLAMNQGEIATQIRTDVPGLEAALKSAWSDLSQDWQSRGWKLAQPDFASATTSSSSRQDTAGEDRRSGQPAHSGLEDGPDFGPRAFGPARLKHAGAAPVTLSGIDALRAAALARRGIHTWA